MTDVHDPIAILGAGPTGLEAALTAVDAGRRFVVYEAGERVGSYLGAWGHVRLFSPWHLDVSPRMRRHLAGAGIEAPAGDDCPTGAEVQQVLEQVAALPAVAPHLRLGQRVRAVGRQGLLKHQAIAAPERAAAPFRLLIATPDGGERIDHAATVLDTTGTYDHPNAAGDSGIPAPGEDSLDGVIERHIPDVIGQADTWAGRRILLLGAGHSAQTAAEALAALAARHAETRVTWALRRAEPAWPTIENDALPARSALIARAQAIAQAPPAGFSVRCGVAVERFDRDAAGVRVTLRGTGGGDTVTVDRILALTGYVGDHRLYRQLQVHECYATSGPMKLAAALLGESFVDCMAQTSHGADTLRNPEPGFFILGAKSYGRNTTFLMRVGWQQVEEVFGLLGAAAAC